MESQDRRRAERGGGPGGTEGQEVRRTKRGGGPREAEGEKRQRVESTRLRGHGETHQQWLILPGARRSPGRRQRSRGSKVEGTEAEGLTTRCRDQ